METQQRALGPWQSAGVSYLSLRIHLKSYIFPLKVAATVLSGSGKSAVGVY